MRWPDKYDIIGFIFGLLFGMIGAAILYYYSSISDDEYDIGSE